jgi:hypothetical protein
VDSDGVYPPHAARMMIISPGVFMEFRHYFYLFIMVISSCQNTANEKKTIIWKLDNLDNINEHKVSVLGNPKVITTPEGLAMQFDGKNDAVLVDTIPVPDFTEFTIEVIFRPDSGGNKEQRFFHIQETLDYRILMETRLIQGNQWFLDSFIKSGDAEQALYAKNYLHPTDCWYHAALVYDGENMRHFVDGKKELEKKIDYIPISSGRTSIGCRLNQVYWFKGAIREICVTPSILSPGSFKLLCR